MQPGNILDGSEREYYTSAPFELPAGAAVTRISAGRRSLARRPGSARSSVRHPTAEALEHAEWIGPDNGAGWFTNDQQIAAAAAGQWVQYRIALGAVNSGSTPRVTEVRVHYA